MTFDEFAASFERRLRAALVAAFGPDVGVDATAEALAYGWRRWAELEQMDNPVGYLYRVGQTAARRDRRRQGLLPSPPPSVIPDFEPQLLPALADLSESQRVCVVLVHAYSWTPTEVAHLLSINVSSVRTHLTRGIDRLRASIGGTSVH